MKGTLHCAQKSSSGTRLNSSMSLPLQRIREEKREERRRRELEKKRQREEEKRKRREEERRKRKEAEKQKKLSEKDIKIKVPKFLSFTVTTMWLLCAV